MEWIRFYSDGRSLLKINPSGNQPNPFWPEDPSCWQFQRPERLRHCPDHGTVFYPLFLQACPDCF
jgi:hypothetical protein